MVRRILIFGTYCDKDSLSEKFALVREKRPQITCSRNNDIAYLVFEAKVGISQLVDLVLQESLFLRVCTAKKDITAYLQREG
jgi:hypothetical protein